MALVKEGYRSAIRGNISISVNLNEDGNIAAANETIAGKKNFTIRFANAENIYSANDEIFKLFLGFVNASYIPSTNKMTVTWSDPTIE